MKLQHTVACFSLVTINWFNGSQLVMGCVKAWFRYQSLAIGILVPLFTLFRSATSVWWQSRSYRIIWTSNLWTANMCHLNSKVHFLHQIWGLMPPHNAELSYSNGHSNCYATPESRNVRRDRAGTKMRPSLSPHWPMAMHGTANEPTLRGHFQPNAPEFNHWNHTYVQKAFLLTNFPILQI